ncbi:MAG: acetylesterase [Firmicutes bacterium]|nr:acetylesterase [Bacillota bacterium]
MAYIKMNVFSRCLMRATPVTVILPLDRFPFPGVPEREDKPFKTLYLLHGGFGSPNDYLYYTNIKEYAESRDLAVVIPAGDNLFFSDQKQFHSNYSAFVGDELVRLMNRMFPLSTAREDTFLAGFSMGGYSALKIGLKYGRNFGYAAGFSAPTILDGLQEGGEQKLPEILGGKAFIEAVFGDAASFRDSEHNLAWFAARQTESGAAVPKLYLSVGTSDLLADDCVRLGGQLKDAGCEVAFRTGPGGHDWAFWNAELKYIVENWLPTEEDRYADLPGFLEADLSTGADNVEIPRNSTLLHEFTESGNGEKR